MEKNLKASETHSILVIGGCGFIGSHVIDALLGHGCQITVLDHRLEAFRDPIPGVKYLIGDLSDKSLLTSALSNVDTIIHLASSTVPATSNLEIKNDISQNLILSIGLFELMQKMGVKNIVFMSSGGTVYGIPEVELIPENHPSLPISSYGIIKSTIEKYLHFFSYHHGFNCCILRASNPYGPRQSNFGVQGVIGTFLRKTLEGAPIEIWGDGSVVRDFIYVEDLANLCVKATLSKQSGIFNAGSGEGASILNVLKIVENAVALKLTPIYKPSRSYDVPRVVLDISHAKKTFGWEPIVDLTDGIATTWEWMNNNALFNSNKIKK